jgi:quercetin dioxygenase-like cupin family protein
MEIAESTKRESAPGPEDWFSGRAWIEELGVLPAQSPTRILLVTFEPSARTAWHRHPFGQVLHIVSGTAWVQRDGGPIVELRTGDSVSFAPDERHWHGAAAASLMSHLAVQATDEAIGKETLWEEKVEDAAYLAGPGG